MAWADRFGFIHPYFLCFLIQILDLWAEFRDREGGQILQELSGQHVDADIPLPPMMKVTFKRGTIQRM